MKLKIALIVLSVILAGGNVYFYIQGAKKNAELNNKLIEAQAQLGQATKDAVSTKTSNENQPADLQLANITSSMAAVQTSTCNENIFPGEIVSKDSTDYKTVKLTNGQIYYGIINSYVKGTLTLTDIYYTQGFIDFANPTTGSQPSISLIKGGHELDAPEDKKLISDSSIISIETLSHDSQLYLAIQQYTTTQPNR